MSMDTDGKDDAGDFRRRPMPSRYRVAGGPEIESEPGSRRRVLRNKHGIKRKREMDQAEFDALVRAQEEYLGLVSAGTRFTASTICEMHGGWLGGLYEWAGRYRTVDLEKDGFAWPPAALVWQNMERFESGTLAANTPCAPASLTVVSRRIAIVHAELMLIHPFREGNGRLGRWLAQLMALQAGFPAPEYRFVGKNGSAERASYLGAIKDGYLEKFDPLAGFFADAIGRRLDTDESGR
jgi:cell filamentation protein